MRNSNQHVHYNVPHVLIGGINGRMKGGRHIAYPTRTVPTGNLLLTILGNACPCRDACDPALRTGS
jgi:hypothetical protein